MHDLQSVTDVANKQDMLHTQDKANIKTWHVVWQSTWPEGFVQ